MAQHRHLKEIPSNTGRRSNRQIGHEGVLEWLKVGELRVDRRYQRGINQRRVGELISQWNDDAFGVILVSMRENGSYYMVDGQHRQQALIAMGLEDYSVPCFVMSGLSIEEEADSFWRYNKTRLQPGSADTFRARIVAGEQAALDIQALCTKNNVNIMYYPSALGPNEVFAIGAMEKIYESGDLDWVLGIIREGWTDQPSALRQERMLGMWRFLQVFRLLLDENYPLGRERRAHLVSKMREFPPSVIADKALEFKTTLHSRPSTAFARAVHYYFNARIKTSHVKLPVWPATTTGSAQD